MLWETCAVTCRSINKELKSLDNKVTKEFRLQWEYNMEHIINTGMAKMKWIEDFKEGQRSGI